MYVVHIEHGVASFDEWKKLFDGDPLGRGENGVRTHRVFRDRDDPNHVMVDLVFDDAGQAEAFRDALRELWGRVAMLEGAQARVAELVEQEDYGTGG